MLVTISGIDGSGKSTLATALENELTLRNLKVKVIEFPCSKVWTMLELLKKRGNYYEVYGKNSTSVGMALNLERLAFIYETVLPNLGIYDVVILQRFVLDFAAIGMTQNAGEEDLMLIKDIHEILPDRLSFFVDTDQAEAYSRIKKRGVSSDIREQYEFHQKMYFKYQSIFKKEIFDVYRLDGNLSVKEIVSKSLETIFEMGLNDEKS